jgi:hypothetical protein
MCHCVTGRSDPLTQRHGVISRNKEIVCFTAAKTSVLTLKMLYRGQSSSLFQQNWEEERALGYERQAT